MRWFVTGLWRQPNVIRSGISNQPRVRSVCVLFQLNVHLSTGSCEGAVYWVAMQRSQVSLHNHFKESVVGASVRVCSG